MKRLRLIAAWVWRAWPVLALLAAALLHTVALSVFASHSAMVNKLTGTIAPSITEAPKLGTPEIGYDLRLFTR